MAHSLTALQGAFQPAASPLSPRDMPTETTEDDPFAGWKRAEGGAVGGFNDLVGRLYYRTGADGRIECRAETGPQHRNIVGSLHGGYLMAFIDQALFVITRPVLGPGDAVTLTCNTEFLGAAVPGKPLDATGEILRETGRLLFMRGLVTQDGSPVCAFSATLRKVPLPA